MAVKPAPDGGEAELNLFVEAAVAGPDVAGSNAVGLAPLGDKLDVVEGETVCPGDIPGDEGGVADTLGDAPIAEAGLAVPLGATPGDGLCGVMTPSDDPGDAGDCVDAPGDTPGDVSGSGIPVGVAGSGMFEPGTSDAWLLAVAGLLGVVGDRPEGADGEFTALPGDEDASEAAGVADGGEAEGGVADGGVAEGGSGLYVAGIAAGLVWPGVEVGLGVAGVDGVVVTAVGLAVAAGGGEDCEKPGQRPQVIWQ